MDIFSLYNSIVHASQSLRRFQITQAINKKGADSFKTQLPKISYSAGKISEFIILTSSSSSAFFGFIVVI